VVDVAFTALVNEDAVKVQFVHITVAAVFDCKAYDPAIFPPVSVDPVIVSVPVPVMLIQEDPPMPPFIVALAIVTVPVEELSTVAPVDGPVMVPPVIRISLGLAPLLDIAAPLTPVGPVIVQPSVMTDPVEVF